MTKREQSKRIEEVSRQISDINGELTHRIETNKKIEEMRRQISDIYTFLNNKVNTNRMFNDYKKQSEQKINNLEGYIDELARAISVNTDKKLSALQNKIDSLKNEIKYLKAVVVNNDNKYEMLLDYFKLEEKEYAELEEQGKFRTFKDVSNLIGGPINIEAVKKTKLVKKK
jgi:chromosome segregation ATPase